MDDPRQRKLFIRSGFMGPLRRDTLSSSDSFSARNSKGGIMLGSRDPGFQSFIYKSSKSIIQSATMDPPNDELTRKYLRLWIINPLTVNTVYHF